jgi:uncharacterized protein (TIGR01777 family)
MRIAVTGSSGLIGSALVDRLRAGGHEVLRLVRSGPAGDDGIEWSPTEGTIDGAGLEGVEAVVHLAGAGIADKRWSDARKRVILESRTTSTDLLARTLAGLDRPPSVLVSGSAIGIYGDRGDEVLTEDSSPGEGFLADVCVAWEAAADPAREAGIRVVHPRTGLVLSSEGGALAKQLPLFKAGVGGKLGSGDQWWSWISMEDELGALESLLDADLEGPVNLTGPAPVTNAEFADVLGDVLGRPSFVPVPRFGPKLLLGGELAEELLFTSARVQPTRLEEAGYAFTHPTAEAALRSELG